jgi:hypothetical protein
MGRGVMEEWSDGVMEEWSDGVMGRGELLSCCVVELLRDTDLHLPARQSLGGGG